jgi:hypothetical protein
MALTQVAVPVNGTPAAPAVAYGAPLVTQVIAYTGNPKFLDTIVGATATTVGIVRHGNHPDGTAKADFAVALTNARRIISLNDPEYVDSSRNITVTFSQVASVTGGVLEFTP